MTRPIFGRGCDRQPQPDPAQGPSAGQDQPRQRCRALVTFVIQVLKITAGQLAARLLHDWLGG